MPVGVHPGRDAGRARSPPGRPRGPSAPARRRRRTCTGPASSGRPRNSATWASSSAAITLTCDLRQPGDAQGLDQLLHPPRADTRAGSRSPPPWSARARRGGGAPAASPGSSCPRAASGSPRPGCRPGCRTPGAGSRCGRWSAPGEVSPYGAPQTASASADISVFMNVVSIERSRSGDADPSCSCRNRAGSILQGAVIAWFSCRDCGRSSRRSRGGRPTRLRHARHRACRTPLWWTPLPGGPAPSTPGSGLKATCASGALTVMIAESRGDQSARSDWASGRHAVVHRRQFRHEAAVPT